MHTPMTVTLACPSVKAKNFMAKLARATSAQPVTRAFFFPSFRPMAGATSAARKAHTDRAVSQKV